MLFCIKVKPMHKEAESFPHDSASVISLFFLYPRHNLNQ